MKILKLEAWYLKILLVKDTKKKNSYFYGINLKKIAIF